MMVWRMLKVNIPETSAAPTISAMLVKSSLLMLVKSVFPLRTNCSMAVIESPTRLGASTANTREETVNSNPNSNRNLYFLK